MWTAYSSSVPIVASASRCVRSMVMVSLLIDGLTQEA